MKIGIFTDCYFPIINGVVTSTELLKNELEKMGHIVYIFTTSHPSEAISYANIIRIPSIPFVLCKPNRIANIYDLKTAYYLKSLKLDIIHTQTEFSVGLFGHFMAKKLQIPHIHTYHTMYKDYTHYITRVKFDFISNNFAKVFSRSFCNKADLIIAPSRKVSDLLKGYKVHTPCKIIPTGIDNNKFNNTKYSKKEILELKKNMNIPEHNKIILIVGRIAKEKSIDLVIKSMPKIKKYMPNTKLLIVGDGPNKKSLLSLVRKLNLGDSTIFTGWCPWEDVGKYYNMADVFISVSNTETQGLTILEAMSFGIPVLVRNDRNIEEIIIDNFNGKIIFNIDNIPQLVYNILTDNQKREMITSNSRRTLSKLSSTKFTNSIVNIYNDLLVSKNEYK